MKALLSRAGRAFTVRNVDEDDAAYDELMALGVASVPLTIIGAHRIRGFNPTALRKALTTIDEA